MSRRTKLAIGLGVALVAGGAIAGAILAAVGPGTLTVQISEEPIELLQPRWLALVGIAPLLLWVLALSLADLPRPQRWLGLLVRVAMVAALAIALSRPAESEDATRVATVWVVDVSESVTDASLEQAAERLREAWEARGENSMSLVTFARDAEVVAIGEESPPARIERHRGEGAGAGTHIQSALQLAYGLFPPGHLRRVVLLSDGGETEGDLLRETARARELGVRVMVYPFREGAPPEVAALGMGLPERPRVGEPFNVRARIFSTTETRARVRLYQGETLNGLDSIRDVELERGETEVTFRSVVRVAGPVTYTLTVEPEGPDRFAANNRYASTLIVPGRPTVLYVEGAPARATYLASALTAAELDVDVRSPRALPTSLRELERFDFVILSDVPADEVSLTQQEVIERYVRELGGGFIMAGGDRSFGLGGWQGTRIERLLPVHMSGERRRDAPTLALSLVIDTSGSMSGSPMELAKEAAAATAQMLGPDDYIQVIGFDSQPTRVVRMQTARNRVSILRDIGRLTARGGTAIFPALDMAYQDLVSTRARTKHVILLTDGQTAEQGIPELAQAARAENITVSVVGLGRDVNRTLLQQVASVGGGRAYFTQDPHNIPRIFMRETSTVARSDVVEEYFRPIVRERADFLRGIDLGRAPYLHGYVATRAKPRPVQVVLVSDLGEPILARWRVGLGWSLAWTSDVKNRWSVEWLRWSGYSRFWAQLVREHMRQRRQQTLDMTAEVIDSEVRVAVDAIDDSDRFLNGLESTLRIEGPMTEAGSRRRADVERISEEHPLRQTAPGRYEARFPLEAYGSFMLTAEHRMNGRPIAESSAELVNPYPREYATLEPDVALLERAARATGGAVEPETSALFDPGDERIEYHEERWPRFLFLALLLFVLDLMLRRVRLFDRRFRSQR